MPHLARNLYYTQPGEVLGSLNLQAEGGEAEEYIFSSDGTLDRPLDVLLVSDTSVPDFFYIREESETTVRSVSVRLDNTRNREHRMGLSIERAGVMAGGTPLLAVPDGLMYAPQRVWFKHTAADKQIHRSLKEDNLKLVLSYGVGSDLLGLRDGADELLGQVSGVADFEHDWGGNVAGGWTVTGGTPFLERRPVVADGTTPPIDYVLGGAMSQGVVAQPGETVQLTLADALYTLAVGQDYDFRVAVYASAELPGGALVLDAGGVVAGSAAVPQALNSEQPLRSGLWTTVAGVVHIEQSRRDDGSLVYAADGTTPATCLRPAVSVTVPADAPGPVTLRFDSARLRRVMERSYDVEVTGFGVPVGGLGEDGQPTLPLFSDVLSPEDLARRMLGRLRGVLGEADDPENPAWAILSGVAHAQWPQYLWTAFKHYRLDPMLCPHRELRSLAAMMGEPMFYGMQPDERRQYVLNLLELIRTKGSSACLLRVCRLMNVSDARISKLDIQDPEFRWRYVIFLNARLGFARLSTLRQLINHWSPAFMSYEIVEGTDPWVLNVSQLDAETILSDRGAARSGSGTNQ